MTELQKTELELLRTFVAICDQLSLNYYLVCGSALGAVKYGGFIPWDDDVDVGLPREDYERFLREAPALLPEAYFLQNYMSDPAYPHIFSKLRDSRTTYIEKSVAHLRMHHGVYLDIFPLDSYPTDPGEQKQLEKTKAACQKKLSCVFRMERNLKAEIGYRLRRLLGYHKRTQAILETYTNAISLTPTDASHIWCNHGNWQGKLEYAARAQYGNGIMMKFEGLDVRVPERYDEYLTQKYGDWRAELPPEQKQGHHYYDIMDLHAPYTRYVEK